MAIDLNGYDGSGAGYYNDVTNGGSAPGGGFDWGGLVGNLLPLITTAGGALLGGQGQTTTQTQNNIPSWQQPFLQAGFTDAARLYGQGPQQYFPGSTVAPLSATTMSALGRMGADNSGMWGNVQNYLQGSFGPGSAASNLVAGGAPQAKASGYSATDTGETGYAQNVVNGQYLNSNSYSDQIAGQLRDDAQASVMSQFGGAGRSMSGAAARALAQQVGDTEANFRGSLYENERNRQMQAAGLLNAISGRKDQAAQFGANARNQASMFNAGQGLQGILGGLNYGLGAAGLMPGLDAARMAGNREAFGAGSYLDAYGQRQLDDSVNRWNFNQEAPWQSLARYLGSVGGTGYGGTITQQNPGNPLLGALGGLQMGSVLSGIFNQKPAGTP